MNTDHSLSPLKYVCSAWCSSLDVAGFPSVLHYFLIISHSLLTYTHTHSHL